MELEEQQPSNEDGDYNKTQIMKALLTARKLDL
jgi:hypothetical protein